ncbi:uncharacterized protein LOC123290412 [Chrysoperla carnea]|uniref:uncharacterized protein LOC123290412 n=1 Tax=Chrysoperla carnea TaxID=189513 RepID=UPI001D05D50F|nr:uncharacterized protein LOC123290412 [Chrysoperla carnea]
MSNFPKHDFQFDYTPMYIMITVFVLFVILASGYACYYQRKQQELQRELAAQGYSIGVMNIGGREGFIAIPPQQPQVVQVQQVPPPGPQSPPPYNSNYSQASGYTSISDQTKY